jgi:hypothetical protein
MVAVCDAPDIHLAARARGNVRIMCSDVAALLRRGVDALTRALAVVVDLVRLDRCGHADVWHDARERQARSLVGKHFASREALASRLRKRLLEIGIRNRWRPTAGPRDEDDQKRAGSEHVQTRR